MSASTLKWSLLLVCISASIARSFISAPNKEGASILLRMAFISTKSRAMDKRRKYTYVKTHNLSSKSEILILLCCALKSEWCCLFSEFFLELC